MPAKPDLGPARAADEKISLNIGAIDLGQIDLLVQEGFYSNRSDLIRTAIRRELERREVVVQRALERRMMVLGLHHFTSADLLAVRANHEQLRIRVLGLASFDADITPDLARETIASLTVLGAIHAEPALRKLLLSLTDEGPAAGAVS